MNFISTLAVSMGASWVSGINLYATVATLGLLGRFAHLKLPGDLDVVTNWWVIGVALFLFVIEFIADKIQLVDSVWDIIHTFIRIPAGAVLAATALINTSPEPVSNIVVSLSEDILAVVTVVSAVFLPVVVFLIIAVGLIFSFWLLPRVIRFFRKVYQSIRGFFSLASA